MMCHPREENGKVAQQSDEERLLTCND